MSENGDYTWVRPDQKAFSDFLSQQVYGRLHDEGSRSPEFLAQKDVDTGRAKGESFEERVAYWKKYLAGSIVQCPENKKLLEELKGFSISVNTFPLFGPLEIASRHRTIVEKLLQNMETDLTKNDKDLYGDGDQSHITIDRQVVREIWNIGGDFRVHLMFQTYSPFAMACIKGDGQTVKRLLDRTSPCSKERMQLLERREAGMHVSPLTLTVAFAKHPAIVESDTGVEPTDEDYLKVVKILLEYGARPDVKCALGKTLVHYGAGTMATPTSLKLTDCIIQAYESGSHLLGQTVIVQGLEKAPQYNGCMGVLGGHSCEDSDFVKGVRRTVKKHHPLGRRVIYIDHPVKCAESNRKQVANKKELAVRPKNIFLFDTTKNETGQCIEDSSMLKCRPKLVDVQDRIQSVALHEVAMSQRGDVTDFLIKIHGASVNIEDTFEAKISPKSMAYSSGATQIKNSVLNTIRAKSIKESIKLSHATRACACCGMKGATVTQVCAQCKITFYCGRDCQKKHWKEGGHKKDCSQKIAGGVCKGIRLTKWIDGNKRGFSGKYQKPRGVKTGEEFLMKVSRRIEGLSISDGDRRHLLYDETRTCEFFLSQFAPGWKELEEATAAEQGTNGLKCHVYASFDEDGICTIYPHTATLKKW